MSKHEKFVSNQQEMILSLLQSDKYITAVSVMRDIGCMKLATRISELRSKGIPIEDEWVNGTNRFGKPITYKKYMLDKNWKEDHEQE